MNSESQRKAGGRPVVLPMLSRREAGDRLLRFLIGAARRRRVVHVRPIMGRPGHFIVVVERDHAKS